MKTKSKIITYISMFIVYGIIFYLALPVINLMYFGLPFLVILIGLTIILVEFNINNCINIIGMAICIIGAIFLIAIPLFTTPALGRSYKYLDIIGEVKESSFTNDISPVDVNKIRLVDQSMASKLGDKTIGQDPALGSSSYVGKFSIQTYRGELFWVAPLLHRSFFKWIGSKDGSKGYIMVSATNPQDVRLIQDKGKIKFQPDAFFSSDLKRHIYLNGYTSKGFTDFTFEINDDGKPYWVISQYKKLVGYSGKDVESIILIDAESGELINYSIDETPIWIDRIQPEQFIVEQVNNWGKFKKGFWNSVLSEEGVLQLTPGMSLVYGKDGVSYWYSGLTSAGADDSTIGFILVNTRTKDFKFYKQAGATETAAMGSAEGKVQEKGYNATFPIMYNIVGRPTYVLSLKDNAGLIKMISMVSVEDYTILGIGETTEEALRNYKAALKRTLTGTDIQDSLNITEVEGIIDRISTDVFKGDTFYYFTLKGSTNNNLIGKTFTLSSQISKDIILSKSEDLVIVKFEESVSDILEVSDFIRK